MSYVEAISAIARAKAGRPEATAYAWQMVGTAPNWTGCEVSICDVDLKVHGTSGLVPDWTTARREQTVMVTAADLEAFVAAKEADQ